MKGLLEYKSLTAAVEDVDFKNRIVTAYWSGFNNLDHDRDKILPGAFTKSIRERGPQGTNEIFYLNQHQWDKPLGRPTLLEEREKGLYAETPVTVTTTYADDALKLMAAGLVVQNSIGFVTIKKTDVDPTGDWRDSYREISEVKLYEGSCVTLGANPETPFTGFKSFTLPELNDQITKMVKLLRDGDLTDEGFGRLEIALKQIQLEAYKLGEEKALQKHQPDDSTDEKQKPQPSVSEALYKSLTKINFS